MTPIRILITWLTIVAAPAVLAGPGQGRHKGPPNDPAAMLDMMSDRLGLTDDQKTRIKTAHEAQAERERVALDALRDARKKFQEAFESEKSGAENLKALHEELVTRKTVMMRLHFDGLLAVRAVLTPDQLKRFSEFASVMHGPGKGRRGTGGMGKGMGKMAPAEGEDN